MGMCSFSIMAIFFIMTAIQLIPSILISDQCTDLDQFLTQNFNQFGLSPTAAAPWIVTQTSTKGGDIFQYFTSCGYPKPELFNAFGQPEKVLADNGINFTDYRVQTENILSSLGGALVLQPPVWSHFSQLESDTAALIGASYTANNLLDCSTSEAVWQPFREAICHETGFAGAIALSTCICFLFSICIIPGVCIGICGYKRFDPANFGPQMDEPQRSKSASSAASSPKKPQHPSDPYAAGLAERPTVGQHRQQSPNRGSIVDPYGSASPIAVPSMGDDSNSSSTGLVNRSGRTTSLAMALDATPQPYQPSASPYPPSSSEPIAHHQIQVEMQPTGMGSATSGQESRVYAYD